MRHWHPAQGVFVQLREAHHMCSRLLASQQALYPLLVHFVGAAFERHDQVRDVEAAGDLIHFSRGANHLPARLGRIVGGNAHQLRVPEARVLQEVDRRQQCLARAGHQNPARERRLGQRPQCDDAPGEHQ